MTGFILAAAAIIVPALTIYAAAAASAPLAAEDHATGPSRAPQGLLNRTGPYPVNYGDRCWHGHCVPWP